MAIIKLQEVAGQKPGRGRPSSGVKPDRDELFELYVQQKLSIREIAEIKRRKKDVIHYWLKKYRLQARSNVSRSQLRNIPLAEIERKIQELGIRGYAREKGIAEGTIRHHLKARRAKDDA